MFRISLFNWTRHPETRRPPERRTFDDEVVPIIHCIWDGLSDKAGTDAGPLERGDFEDLHRIFLRGLPDGEHVRLVCLAVEKLHPGRVAWWRQRPAIGDAA